MTTHWSKLVIIAGLAALGASAQAQMHSTMGDHAGMYGTHQMTPARMEARVARHLNELKGKLHLNASQEPAWAAFATAMKPPAITLMPVPDRAELEKLSTPERIDRMKQIRTQHHEAMKPFVDQRDDAIKAFYATLDTAQKKTFDVEHAHMMRHGSKHR